jgi:hypothetical protein
MDMVDMEEQTIIAQILGILLPPQQRRAPTRPREQDRW